MNKMAEPFKIKINENDLRKVHLMLSDFKGASERVFVRSLIKHLPGLKQIHQLLSVQLSPPKKPQLMRHLRYRKRPRER
jgi:hypothetical protein